MALEPPFVLPEQLDDFTPLELEALLTEREQRLNRIAGGEVVGPVEALPAPRSRQRALSGDTDG